MNLILLLKSDLCTLLQSVVWSSGLIKAVGERWREGARDSGEREEEREKERGGSSDCIGYCHLNKGHM